MKLATGETLIYSGDEQVHEGGVAIMISQQAERLWSGPLSTRES